MADGTAFTGGWGRPQRGKSDDIKAVIFVLIPTLMYRWTPSSRNIFDSLRELPPRQRKHHLGIVEALAYHQEGLGLLCSILEPDWVSRCTYIGLTSSHLFISFDLWEEVSSSSFFTTATQARALREGATLATRLGQTAAAGTYNTQASNTLCFLQSYWNPSGGYITSNTGGGRSGKDANSALASVHLFEPSAGCDATTFQPCSDKALSSLKEYIDSFRQIYPINHGRPANGPVATGRYQEDVYYGGQVSSLVR